MHEWLDDLADLTAAREAVVVITVAAVRGSAPREPGAKMLVTASETIGTIGGGTLEHECTRQAVSMLGSHELPSTRRYPLGPTLGQCCGGVVDVMFEPLDDGLPGWLAELRALHGQRRDAALVTGVGRNGGKFVVTAEDVYGPAPDGLPVAVLDLARELASNGGETRFEAGFVLEPVVASDFDIALFGAGHVGAAVASTLSQLDCNVRWVDSRRNVFRDVPRNVRAVETAHPELEVAAMPPGSYYLVMTHSHALDYEICGRVLRRADAAYCGLIGSRTKRRRFEKRWQAEGVPEASVRRLHCPIGISGAGGKKPAEIAVATAAELLQVRARRKAGAAASRAGNVHPIRRD